MGSFSENAKFAFKVAVVILVLNQVPAIGNIINRNYFA
jgi:hypothetical protein